MQQRKPPSWVLWCLAAALVTMICVAYGTHADAAGESCEGIPVEILVAEWEELGCGPSPAPEPAPPAYEIEYTCDDSPAALQIASAWSSAKAAAYVEAFIVQAETGAAQAQNCEAEVWDLVRDNGAALSPGQCGRLAAVAAREGHELYWPIAATCGGS